MSKQSRLRVSELLPDKLDQLDDIVKHGMNENPARPRRRIPGCAWRIIRLKANGALREILNFDVFQVFGKAWSQAPELHEFTDPTKYPPSREWTVSLATHDLAVTIYPKLEVACHDTNLAEAKLDLELTAEFRSAVLAVRGGRITAVRAGDCEVAATLKYGGFSLPGLKTGEIELAESYEFAPPGLAIL